MTYAPSLTPAAMARWRRIYPDALIVLNDGGPRRLVGWPPNEPYPAGQVEDVPASYAAHAILIAKSSGTRIVIIRHVPEAAK